MNITVFCGSANGNKSVFTDSARQLGDLIGRNSWTLIYGGASIGLMGTVATATLKAGGKVHGVIPRFLDQREIAHPELTKLTVTHSMHERKQIMAESTDIFVALPGGFGTFEEILEIITWRQLGLITKPVGFLNIDGYYTELLSFFKKARVCGFVRHDLDDYFQTWNTLASFERFAYDFAQTKTENEPVSLEKV